MIAGQADAQHGPAQGYHETIMSVSTFLSRLLMTGILSPTFAPPITATKGHSRFSTALCPQIKKHSKKYIKRQNLDTLNSAKRIKTMGIGRMMNEDREKWLCPKCEGVVKFQNKTCSECGFEID